MDCGWDTSDDECGMQIDLDSQTGENQEMNLDKDDVLENDEHHTPDISTDDCDQSEQIKDSSSESSRTEMPAVKNTVNDSAIVDIDDTADLTPASDDQEKTDATITEDKCHLKERMAQNECSDEENDGCWNSEMPQETQNGCSSSHGGENTSSELTSCASPNENLEQNDEDLEEQNCGIVDSLINGKSITEDDECKIKSPSLNSFDTDDENTQNSIFVDSDVSDVAVVSDSVLGKRSARNTVEKDDTHSPYEEKDQGIGKLNHGLEDSVLKNKRQRHEKDRETFRRQEEVNTCNEQVMVNLCRAESDSERIEEDVSKPKKKTRKKGTSKQIKKKGKKLKKGHSKKIKSKLKNEEIVRDHRFVEIREERSSVESKEEGELNGESGNLVYRKSSVERVTVDVYEPVLDETAGDELEDEQREPGEIVDEEKKKRKKKGKKIRKKKKRRRRVATIEEGSQGDGDLQKFPTFLDGFFVQNEAGDEDFEDGLDNMARSFDNNARTFQMGGMVYRRCHSSDSEDNIHSFDQSISYNKSVDSRSGESEHRRSRRHHENGHGGRRQHEIVRSREVRHEQEHHYGTPRVRGRGYGWDRERSRSERDRERVRDNERDIRGRGREYERDNEAVWVRDRDRRRTEMEERRRQQNRSNSHEHRQRSSTTERVSQTILRGCSSRHRHGSKSREESPDRERERNKERSKHKRQNRSPEREPARRVILSSHLQSPSPQNRNGKTGSDKENREERRRTEKVSSLNERDNDLRRIRRKRNDRRRRNSTSSSSTNSSDCVITHRNRNRHNSSDDDDASSDVILVESERVVINLVDEEDPPSRVDMTTQTITDDDNTRLLDIESTSPSVVSGNPIIATTLIEASHAVSKVADVIDSPEVQLEQSNSLITETDYDPAHPTEAEEFEIGPTTPKLNTSSAPPADIRPIPPDHPPPAEARPSLPPVLSLMNTATVISQSQPLPLFASPRPQLILSSPFQEQPRPPLQHLPSMQPFSGLGQVQRFPSRPVGNGPTFNNLPLNNGLHPAFPPAQLGLRSIPETHPIFPPQPSSLPFRSPLPQRPQPVPPREMLPHQMNIQHQMPMSTMAPHVRLPPPSFDKSKMPVPRFDHGMTQSSQVFRPPLPVTSLQSSLLEKNPLISSIASNMSLYHPQPSRGIGCDLSESTEVVDMDMSPRDDNYDFLSPSSSSSDIDNKRKRGRKSSSRVGSSADKVKPSSSTGKGITAVHNEAFSKDVNKLTAKGQMQVSSTSQKLKFQPARKRRLEVSDDDEDDDEDDVPISAVDLTNKEKYMKKLHFQERVIDEVKMAIKPFYNSKKITKEQYKLILRKAVPKVCHSKSGNINPQRILHLVEAYVRKLIRGRTSGGGNRKRKQHPQGLKDTTNPASLRQNGGRGKNVTR